MMTTQSEQTLENELDARLRMLKYFRSKNLLAGIQQYSKSSKI